MATHSSTLARKIPWLEEPGGLQSMGSERVRQVHSLVQVSFISVQQRLCFSSGVVGLSDYIIVYFDPYKNI